MNIECGMGRRERGGVQRQNRNIKRNYENSQSLFLPCIRTYPTWSVTMTTDDTDDDDYDDDDDDDEIQFSLVVAVVVAIFCCCCYCSKVSG